MTTDLFTKQRERNEAKQGLPTENKTKQRQEIEEQTKTFLANGGHIEVIPTEPTCIERRRINKENKKLSAKEIDRKLKEFASTGKVTF